MKWALVKNGIVDNIIISDETFIEGLRSVYQDIIQLEEGIAVDLGWKYESGNFINPKPVSMPTPPSGPINPPDAGENK